MSKLLIDERPLTVLPSLVTLVGMERAVILQQIHWLSQQKNTGVVLDDGERWVWGTHKEWCDEFFPFWDADTLRKHLKRLAKDGFIFICQPNGFNRTNHYRINREKFDAEESAMRHDHAGSKRKNFRASMRHDRTGSKRYDRAGSNREDDATSKRHDDAASYNEKTTTETTAESTQKRDVGEAPTPHPDSWNEFLGALCWVCHQHQDLKALTQAQIGALTAEAKLLRNDGYTRADLRAWMENHWYTDWRWQNGKQRPRPDMVRAMIPVLRAATYAMSDGLPDVNGNGPPAQLDVTPPAPPSPWEALLRELQATMTQNAFAWLEDSELVAAGEVPNGNGEPVPL